MKFTYETQGAITYLVCELDANEQIDSLTLGMLTNNHIQGLAPVLYTEMNGQRYLKYNISAKVTVEQFFSGSMNKQRTLTAFSNILNALCSADEYMIDQNCFSVAPEHIFLNVSNCETALICVPVVVEKDINAEVAGLFKRILFSTQFDQNEDAGYITQLITCLNSGPAFNAYVMKDLVANLQAGNTAPAQPAYKPPVQPVAQPAAPASSFDSTISIDDMPASMGGRQQPVQPQVQRPVQQPVQQPQAPAARPIAQQMPPQQPVQQPMQQRPVTPAAPVQQPGMRQTVKPQTPQVNIPKPPVSNGPGFAIPGQPAGRDNPAPAAASAKAEKPKKEKNKKEKSVVTPQIDEEKKMSFFGLLAHYSKENAALYKAQREAEKQAKTTDAPAKQAVPSQGKQPAIPQTQVPGGVVPMQHQQAFTQPQVRPAVQPVPVQNSFNETTVLTPMMAGGGETTVLSAEPVRPNPCLTRTKTGERISINKPVFRIGKEKSYVDYFIGDNTAISRSHCNIHCDNGEYFIEDTNSTNHTYVNGKIITSNVKTKLVNGDQVRLANEDFTFSV